MPLEDNGFLKRRTKNGPSCSFIDDVPKSKSAHDCLLGVNEKLLLNDNRDRYSSSRRAYRSVAYKTWTVGSARKLLTKSLSVSRNGFVSDSDSFDDEQTSRPSRRFVCATGKPQQTISRDSINIPACAEPRRENGNLQFKPNVRFDQKTDVDYEFRAVIDTFKDLQNFIAGGSKNKHESRKRPDNFINCSKCISRTKGRDFSLSNDKLLDKNSNVNFLESFENPNQAIRFLTEELVKYTKLCKLNIKIY